MKVDTEGEMQLSVPSAGGPVIVSESDIDLQWKYPQQVGLGASYQAVEKVRVNFDAIWTEWSYWDEVPVDIKGSPADPPPYDVGGQDAWKFGLGVEYYVA